MRVWYFSEMAYHPAWDEGLSRGSMRVVLPSKNFDPQVGHGLLNRYLDEFALCDEVGLDIMVNEHHSTATCLTVSVSMALAILARETKRARLLSLGTPIANRPDPVRVAEEMAWLDVLSGGRLEMGLVKGAPYEIAPANSNPANLMRRYWEAHDLILKAMSTTDGPFNWEGEFFHYRNVNIWPRPLQQPTPPVWMTGLSADTGRAAAERGHVIGTLLSGAVAKPMFDAYRKRAQELGWTAGPDRFAYAAVVGVGDTREEGYRRADLAAGYVRTAPVVLEPFTNPPGYNSVGANVAMLKAGPKRGGFVLDRDGKPLDHRTATVEQFMASDTVFAGTPDDVFNQIRDFNDRIGGFGHLLFFGQGGFLDHNDTVANITLFAREVLPRLRELSPAPARTATAAVG
ncbi:LLM class flavin-dependent oxidoreductase [Vineibacter terrae]|uniref:LLM class flavin-dependent oxidoreductase n=1 Tax=Vineibacter terrae TaxID=2586908 RepID=UPI002E33C15A|nr:LLM class flavin-dependent oxidoreductase [Vineibacter terrae]HEX2891000.1 LLM class flavin-dependent oxidoreductase [Vineibacter terrae]